MENHNSNKAKEKRKRALWTPEEDMKLYNYITTFGVNSWSTLPQKAGLQRCEKSCRLRWLNHLDPKLKKCPISPEEERLIISLHNFLGNSWSKIAESLPGRTDNEIKNFWNCHLKKKFRKLGIDTNSKEQSSGSVSMQDTSMSTTSEIAESLPGRTDNEIKNFWNCHLKKKFRKLGIDTNSKEQSSGSVSMQETSMSTTSEATDTKNMQKLETENGTHNLGNQSNQLTTEAMVGVTSWRDYMNSLEILINQDEIRNNIKDDSLDALLYY